MIMITMRTVTILRRPTTIITMEMEIQTRRTLMIQTTRALVTIQIHTVEILVGMEEVEGQVMTMEVLTMAAGPMSTTVIIHHL